MRRMAAVFVLIASFALLGSTSPAMATNTPPVTSTVGGNDRPLDPDGVQFSSPRNPDLFAIIAWVRRELTHPPRLAAHWR